MNFIEYRNKFEEKAVKGMSSKLLGREEQVSVRRGRLSKSIFGKLMGLTILSSLPCAIDYYGYFKKSNGFFDLLKEVLEEAGKMQVKSLNVPVVRFATIKIEHVSEFAPELAGEFAIFKKKILEARGFVKNGNTWKTI